MSRRAPHTSPRTGLPSGRTATTALAVIAVLLAGGCASGPRPGPPSEKDCSSLTSTAPRPGVRSLVLIADGSASVHPHALPEPRKAALREAQKKGSD